MIFITLAYTIFFQHYNPPLGLRTVVNLWKTNTDEMKRKIIDIERICFNLSRASFQCLFRKTLGKKNNVSNFLNTRRLGFQWQFLSACGLQQLGIDFCYFWNCIAAISFSLFFLFQKADVNLAVKKSPYFQLLYTAFVTKYSQVIKNNFKLCFGVLRLWD